MDTHHVRAKPQWHQCAASVLCPDGAAGVVARDEVVQPRPLGERHHQGGGRGSLLDLAALLGGATETAKAASVTAAAAAGSATAVVVATETAVAETAMAAAGWATTAAEAATALGAKWPEAPRDRLEATSLRTPCRDPKTGAHVKHHGNSLRSHSSTNRSASFRRTAAV